MNDLWTPLVRRLNPYVPGEQPSDSSLIKLNTNECPYGPSPAVLDATKSAVGEQLRLYPDPQATELRQSIAEFYSLPSDHVFVGNGSDEVLAFVFQAFFTNGKPLLFPDVSYSFYPVYCNLFDIKFNRIPVRDDMRIELSDYGQDKGGVIFPNPNAPTSLATSTNELELFVKNNPDSVIVVDEAYVDFGAETVVPLTRKYPNLLVTQTFSKSRSLAGMRIGFAIGHPSLIEALVRVKDSFNSYPLDRLAQVAGVASMQDTAYFKEVIGKIISTRESTRSALVDNGFHVKESKANFLFAKHPDYSGEQLGQICREADILIRHWSAPRISDYIRITVGTDEDMAALLAVLLR